MYTLAPLATVKTIVTASTDVGAVLPKPVVEAHARAVRVTTSAQTLHPGPEALTAAVLTALDDGRDPAADPEVQRVHLASILGDGGGIPRAVEDMIGGQLVSVITEHAEAVLTAWATPFDKAAATLRGAHEQIGDVPLDDTATILRAGGDIAATWADATAAARVVATLAAAWVGLAQVSRFAPVEPNRAALRFADVTLEQADRLNLRTLTAWDAVRAGLPLALADALTYRRRVAALTVEPEPLRPRDFYNPLKSSDPEPITAA